MQPLPGKLYKIPKMKNKSFFILNTLYSFCYTP